ncbi:unnamed protein product, partial [marine sediment metagenome]
EVARENLSAFGDQGLLHFETASTFEVESHPTEASGGPFGEDRYEWSRSTLDKLKEVAREVGFAVVIYNTDACSLRDI